jgi:hypothetical protein
MNQVGLNLFPILPIEILELIILYTEDILETVTKLVLLVGIEKIICISTNRLFWKCRLDMLIGRNDFIDERYVAVTLGKMLLHNKFCNRRPLNYKPTLTPISKITEYKMTKYVVLFGQTIIAMLDFAEKRQLCKACISTVVTIIKLAHKSFFMKYPIDDRIDTICGKLSFPSNEYKYIANSLVSLLEDTNEIS